MTSSESPIDASIVDSAEVQRSGELGSGPSQLGALVHTYPVAVVAVAAGIAARVVFWAMTDRRFEKTASSPSHMRERGGGMGLTHHAGEPDARVHVGDLSPCTVGRRESSSAGLDWRCFAWSPCSPLQLRSRVRLGSGGSLEISQWLMVFPFAYLAFDQNQIFYGMAGMETQMATAILLAAIYALMTRACCSHGGGARPRSACTARFRPSCCASAVF